MAWRKKVFYVTYRLEGSNGYLQWRTAYPFSTSHRLQEIHSRDQVVQASSYPRAQPSGRTETLGASPPLHQGRREHTSTSQ